MRRGLPRETGRLRALREWSSERLALQQGASVADPFLREVQDFMERWGAQRRERSQSAPLGRRGGRGESVSFG